MALQDVAGRSTASVSEIVPENALPTLPVKLCPLVIIGAPTAIEIFAVSVSVPPGPVAVRVIVVVSTSCGVPVIWPVEELIEAQVGSPVALHEVTGRFAESVSENVLENASPTFPDPVWFGGMIGVPSEIEKLTSVAGLVPPLPVAVMEAVKLPFAVGVPVIAPVLAVMESPSGSPVTLQDVAGRSRASSSAMFAENASPTLPVNVCPAVMSGTPMAMEIVAVSVSVPPGPVAVMVIVVLPLSCGVPVIWPLLEVMEAQDGSPVADHEVTGRLVLSVSENVFENASPTLPDPVWPEVMMGAPSAIVKLTLTAGLVPPLPVAVTEAVKLPFVVGVPVIAPVLVFIERPDGMPVAAHAVAG